MDIDQVEADFRSLQEDERVLAVLVFGSQVTGQAHERSDIDICVVACDTDPIEMMRTIWQTPEMSRETYDVHTFEEFSLKMKHQVIEDHQVVWCRDGQELEEYFYQFRKLWNDQAVARGVV